MGSFKNSLYQNSGGFGLVESPPHAKLTALPSIMSNDGLANKTLYDSDKQPSMSFFFPVGTWNKGWIIWQRGNSLHHVLTGGRKKSRKNGLMLWKSRI